MYGAAINDRDKDGRTPFHSAASNDSVEAMEMLSREGFFCQLQR